MKTFLGDELIVGDWVAYPVNQGVISIGLVVDLYQQSGAKVVPYASCQLGHLTILRLASSGGRPFWVKYNNLVAIRAPSPRLCTEQALAFRKKALAKWGSQ